MLKANVSIYKLLLIIAFIVFTVNAQDQNKPLIKIGNDQISIKEFKHRYELSPFVDIGDQDSAKYFFLMSLAAEKLFAIEAKSLGLEQTEEFHFTFKPLEKIYVRDALFNSEIKSKIKVDEENIRKGIIKYNSKLKVEVFGSADSIKIYKIFNELNSGIAIDFLSEVDERDTAEVSFGDINDESIEDSLFSLFVGEYSNPVKTEKGWFLFYLIDKISNVVSTNKSEITSKVDKVIRARRTEKAYNVFMENIFKEKKMVADKDLFQLLSDNIYSVLNQSLKNSSSVSSTQFYLDEEQFELVKKELGSENLDKVFFMADDTPVTLRDFLGDLLLEGFVTKSLDKSEINFKLNTLVKNFMEKECLTNLGYQQGLQNLPEVKEQLEMWEENYLAQFYKNTFIDSAGFNEEEVYMYFLENQSEEKIKHVKIVELLTESLDIVEYVLEQLENGESFKELAKRFTKTKMTKNPDGETDFFPLTSYGEIGRIADNIKIGDIYGPIKVEDGYSIFQLTDVKETRDSIKQTFEETKERIKSILFYNKMNEILTRKTVELANKYKINIDEEAFNSTQLLKIKMYVQRLMGFGGRVAAVPFTTPWYEWIYQIIIPAIP